MSFDQLSYALRKKSFGMCAGHNVVGRARVDKIHSDSVVETALNNGDMAIAITVVRSN